MRMSGYGNYGEKHNSGIRLSEDSSPGSVTVGSVASESSSPIKQHEHGKSYSAELWLQPREITCWRGGMGTHLSPIYFHLILFILNVFYRLGTWDMSAFWYCVLPNNLHLVLSIKSLQSAWFCLCVCFVCVFILFVCLFLILSCYNWPIYMTITYFHEFRVFSFWHHHTLTIHLDSLTNLPSSFLSCIIIHEFNERFNVMICGFLGFYFEVPLSCMASLGSSVRTTVLSLVKQAVMLVLHAWRMCCHDCLALSALTNPYLFSCS